MEILEVAPGQEELLAAWHAVYEQAQRQGQPYAEPWELHEIRAELSHPISRRDLLLYAGTAGGRVVSVGKVELPLLDNTRTATLEVGTAVAERRRGHGSAMLEHLVEVARAHRRTTLFAEVGYRYESADRGSGEPSVEFAVAHGFAFALGEVQRVLDLPVPAPTLDALDAEIAIGRRGYRIEAFAGPVPEPWLASYVALDARVETDAPTGELDLEPQAVDVAAHREVEELTAAQGRDLYAAIALDATERVVGYTAFAMARSGDRAFQWGTLVDAAHRGNRLGLAVKVANLRQLRRHRPDARAVVTWNAEENAPMNAVNDRLGFWPVARLAEFQRRL